MTIQSVGGMNTMINALQATASQAASRAEPLNKEAIGTFADFLNDTLGKVNMNQQHADALAQRLISGDNSVNMHEVMIALQTASLSFQETVQVRNKIMNAYQEIMNMQV